MFLLVKVWDGNKMNSERIRELAEQAGLSHMPSNYSDMADLYKGADFELEKFAELIVRQCGYYADVFSALEYPVDIDPTETKPSDYIKREMGITE